MSDPGAGEGESLRASTTDLLAALAVVLASPVLWRFGEVIRGWRAPDASAYASLARVFASEGLVFLKGWGFADQAVILPPVFPALWALAERSASAPFGAGLLVSNLAALASALAIYWLASRSSNRIVAVAVAVFVQSGFHFVAQAFAPLTESLFTLVTAATLIALFHYVEGGRVSAAIGLGILCGVIVLTRKAGCFVVAFVGIWLLAAAWWDRRPRLRVALLRLALVAGLAALALAPYAAVLYEQTGQHPLQPRFRMGEYEVGTDDPDVISEIAEIELELASDDYETVWAARRKLRRLLPDGSEMYAALSPLPGAATESNSVVGRVIATALAEPVAVLQRLLRNLERLGAALGWPGFALFIATSVAPFCRRLRRPTPSRRALLVGFNWVYLLGVSLVTDHRDRYVVVLIPFVSVQIAVELFALASTRIRRREVATALVVVLLAGAMQLRPDDYGAVEVEDFPIPALDHYAPLREVIPAGEPVFAPTPVDAMLLAGSYRALPNASLEAVVEYAHRTGVRWLVVAAMPHNAHQVSLYDDPWYLLPRRRRNAEIAKWLTPRVSVDAGRFALYETPSIRPLSRSRAARDER